MSEHISKNINVLAADLSSVRVGELQVDRDNIHQVVLHILKLFSKLMVFTWWQNAESQQVQKCLLPLCSLQAEAL